MENVTQNENTPVETIDGRQKRHHTYEIDGRNRLRLREEEGGRAENKDNLEGETMNILKRKTPVEIIEERKQRLHTSRTDTRLWNPVPR